MGAQKNRLIDMVLLSTHNICFGRDLKKFIFITYLESLSQYIYCHLTQCWILAVKLFKLISTFVSLITVTKFMVESSLIIKGIFHSHEGFYTLEQFYHSIHKVHT